MQSEVTNIRYCGTLHLASEMKGKQVYCTLPIACCTLPQYAYCTLTICGPQIMHIVLCQYGLKSSILDFVKLGPKWSASCIRAHKVWPEFTGLGNGVTVKSRSGRLSVLQRCLPSRWPGFDPRSRLDLRLVWKRWKRWLLSASGGTFSSTAIEIIKWVKKFAIA
jgi:hypothetical protein